MPYGFHHPDMLSRSLEEIHSYRSYLDKAIQDRIIASTAPYTYQYFVYGSKVLLATSASAPVVFGLLIYANPASFWNIRRTLLFGFLVFILHKLIILEVSCASLLVALGACFAFGTIFRYPCHFITDCYFIYILLLSV